MVKNFWRLLIGIGFLVLTSFLCFLIAFVLIEYNFFSKNNVGLYPKRAQLPLEKCRSGDDVPRDFSIKGNNASKIPILTYHRIVKEEHLSKEHYIDNKVNPMVVTKEMFEKQMAYLKENEFVTLTLTELYLFLIDDLEIPKKSVVITFDDGYKDNFIQAYPILHNYDFSAVNFIITGSVTTRTHPYNPKKLQYLSSKEIAKACDVFEFQSHTYNYHQKETNHAGQDVSFLVSKPDELIKEDLLQSIHNLNGEQFIFSYPYGEYAPSTIQILKELGFTMAVTTENRAASPNDHLYEIPRFNILAETDFNQFKRYVNQ